MTLVVDASVAIKLFVEERHSGAARRLFARDELLVAPAHIFGEIGEVGVRRLRSGQIGERQLIAIMNYLRMGVTLVPVAEVFESAVAIAVGAATSFYDALYVAVAERWSGLLVTADEKLLAKLAPTQWAPLATPLGRQ